MANIAFITSMGLQFREQLSDVDVVVVNTDYGQVPITVGYLPPSNCRVFSLIRSGHEGSVAPHEVNYRANMLALHQVGVARIIATSVVGTLRTTLQSGQLLLVDQFLDFTAASRLYHLWC